MTIAHYTYFFLPYFVVLEYDLLPGIEFSISVLLQFSVTVGCILFDLFFSALYLDFVLCFEFRYADYN